MKIYEDKIYSLGETVTGQTQAMLLCLDMFDSANLFIVILFCIINLVCKDNALLVCHRVMT